MCMGFNNIIKAQTITDFDNNVYNIITIGTQTWIKENLKVTHYNNGDPIPNIKDDSLWSTLKSGAYCDYDNSASNSLTYGRLYNYYTVTDSRKLCPSGMHVPSDSEWRTLTIYLGVDAGGKMKETGVTHWISPNIGATNQSTFTALPGGKRDNFVFDLIGEAGYWWSSTELQSKVFNELIYNDQAHLYRVESPQNNKMSGYSVRCLKIGSGKIDKEMQSTIFSLYPNPNKGKFNLAVSRGKIINVEVYNVQGEKIHITPNIIQTIYILDLSQSPKGIYIVKVYDGQNTFIRKIRVE